MNTDKPLQSQREINRARIRQIWADRGVKARYPVTTKVALDTIHRLEYAVSRGRMYYYIERDFIKAPPQMLGRLSWDEEAILDFTDQLEANRCWDPISLFHFEKKTEQERQDGLAIGRMEAAQWKAILQLPMKTIVRRMADDDDRQRRNLYHLALKQIWQGEEDTDE